jgi:hypothetical protein
MAFELPPLHRSSVLTRQVLIWGAIVDALTPGEGPRGALDVRLLDRNTNANVLLARKIQPDATYAFYGIPAKVFPPPGRDRTLQLRLEARAPGYLPAGVDIDLGLPANQPARVTRSYAELDLPDLPAVLYTAGLPLEVNLTLQRRAVRLRGRVVQAANPAEGVDGAQVTGGGQTATTGGDGFFEFANPLPVALSISFTVTKAGFEDHTAAFEPDYTRPFNEWVVALTA